MATPGTTTAGATRATGLVVDASVSAAWFLPDEATAFTEAALQATAQCAVWVPSLWLLEIGNLFISAQRRKRIDAAQRKALLGAAQGLRLLVDREPVSMQRIDGLAEQYGLTAYDAAYLELALRRQLPLATLDAALTVATTQAGVPIFEI
jgi:predicted nucleic acid-binding protein